MKVDTLRRYWLRNTLLYTLGGLISSSLIGATAGAIGGLVSEIADANLLKVVAIVVGLAVLLRETSLIDLPLLQWKRQTPAVWRETLPAPVTSLMWGLDLGLVFSTWLKYAGPWFLFAVAISTESILLGAVVFAAYWLGRASWMFFAGFLLQSKTDVPRLADEIEREQPMIRRAHVGGVSLGLVALILSL